MLSAIGGLRWDWIGLLRDGVRWHGRTFDRAEHVEVVFGVEIWHTRRGVTDMGFCIARWGAFLISCIFRSFD